MSDRMIRLRLWLVRLLIGRLGYIANATVKNGMVHLPNSYSTLYRVVQADSVMAIRLGLPESWEPLGLSDSGGAPRPVRPPNHAI